LILKEQLTPLVKFGIRRRDISRTIQSAGIDVSEAHINNILRDLFGTTRNSARYAEERSSSPTLSRSQLHLPPENLTKPTGSGSFTMSFGTEQEALEQERRLARAREKIEVERKGRKV
jgi:hypothetical protein